MSAKTRTLPPFLEGLIKPVDYERWLARKAAAHLKRDMKSGFRGVTREAYRDAIHEAVVKSEGRDAYTGGELHWNLLSQYDNEESQRGRHHYKSNFALLPTVDHIDSAVKKADFCICAWRTNDAKSDLSLPEFAELCRKVLQHTRYKVCKDAEPAP